MFAMLATWPIRAAKRTHIDPPGPAFADAPYESVSVHDHRPRLAVELTHRHAHRRPWLIVCGRLKRACFFSRARLAAWNKCGGAKPPPKKKNIAAWRSIGLAGLAESPMDPFIDGNLVYVIGLEQVRRSAPRGCPRIRVDNAE
jgi:hypothetical protein